jgi:hypothetical protein
VTTFQGAKRIARTWLHAVSGHVAPGYRASLVDAVMDLPGAGSWAELDGS